MAISEIGATLNLDKSRQETLRNYVWALRNETGKYKKLAELMHVDGDWLALNTPEGMEGVVVVEEQPQEDVTEEVDSTAKPIKREVVW